MPRAGRPNLFIKIPGTKEGLPAIEEAIFAGVPINVTLLFSREQYLAAAEAYLRGIERRIDAGLNPNVASVASRVHQPLGRGGRQESCRRACEPARHRDRQAHLQGVPRTAGFAALAARLQCRRASAAAACGPARAPRIPRLADILYVKALAAPFTVNTMPEGTLKALAEHTDSVRIAAGGRRRLRGGAGRVREGGNRCGCAGRAASGRGRQVVRQIVERTDGSDRVQERVRLTDSRGAH